jgi:hypothetical protein
MLRFIIILTFITLCWLRPIQSLSQDIIKKNNGQEMKTKVVEIGDTIVKYKKFDDPEFCTYIIRKKDIKTIKYESGKTISPNKRSKESYLSLWIGPSMPTGIYSNNDPNKSNAGSAKPGLGSSLEFGFKFVKNLGLSFNLGSFHNDFDHSKVDQQLKNNLVSGEHVTTSYSKYEGKFLLMGLQYYVPLGRKFTWVSKVSLGTMAFSKPQFTYNYNDSSAVATSSTAPISYSYTSEKGHGQNLAAGIGTSLWFKLSNRFLLRASVDFLMSRPKVYFNTHNGGYGVYGSNMTPDGEYNKTYKVNVVNAGLSMIFLLKRKR